MQIPIQGYKDHAESEKHVSIKRIEQTSSNWTKEMEIQELINKKIKIIALQMLRELEEHTDNFKTSGKQQKNKMGNSKRRQKTKSQTKILLLKKSD